MYKCRGKKKCLDWMVKKKKIIKKIYIQNKNKNKTLYSKIHKKISLGEYSCLRKKREKEKPFQSR